MKILGKKLNYENCEIVSILCLMFGMVGVLVYCINPQQVRAVSGFWGIGSMVLANLAAWGYAGLSFYKDWNDFKNNPTAPLLLKISDWFHRSMAPVMILVCITVLSYCLTRPDPIQDMPLTATFIILFLLLPVIWLLNVIAACIYRSFQSKKRIAF